METGFKYRLQCLPRTLTLYCEFGSEQMARTSRQQTVKERSAATKVCMLLQTRPSFPECVRPCARGCEAHLCGRLSLLVH